MTFPNFVAGQYLSAAMVNDLTADALTAFGRATAYRQGFRMMDESYTNPISTDDEVVIWQGYMLYKKDTLRYDLTVGGSSQQRLRVYVIRSGGEDQVLNLSVSGAGTVDLPTAGFVSGVTGTIYPVEVRIARSGTTSTINPDDDVSYLALTDTLSYTAPTTFLSTDVITAAQLNAIRTNINALVSAGAYIPAPQIRVDADIVFADDTDPAENAARFGYRHIHDDLRLRFNALTVTGGEGRLRFYYDGNQVYTLDTGTGSEADTVVDLTNSGVHSYTAGNIYVAKITLELNNSNEEQTVSVSHRQASQFANGATPPATVPNLSHGDIVTEAPFNWYGTLYDTIHPEASSPTIPLYYEGPLVRKVTGKRMELVHRDRYLKYVYAGPGTPTISWGNGLTAGLPTGDEDEVLVFDLNEISNLSAGQRYQIDDVYCALEDDDASPYA